MGSQPTIAEQRAVIIQWVHRYYADSVKCLNNLCAGAQKCLRKNMAKVRLLEINIVEAADILTDLQLEELYGRLQCLINMKVDLTIDN